MIGRISGSGGALDPAELVFDRVHFVGGEDTDVRREGSQTEYEGGVARCEFDETPLHGNGYAYQLGEEVRCGGVPGRGSEAGIFSTSRSRQDRAGQCTALQSALSWEFGGGRRNGRDVRAAPEVENIVVKLIDP